MRIKGNCKIMCALFIVLMALGKPSYAQNSVHFSGSIRNGDIIAARVEDKLYVRDTINGMVSDLSNGLYTVVRDTISLFDFAVFNNEVTIDFFNEKPVYKDSLNEQFYRFIRNHLEKGIDLG